jgi:glycogen phosphorylase
MIESINFRTGISLSLLRTAQAALTEIPQRLSPIGRKSSFPTSIRAKSVSRKGEFNRDRWSIAPKPATIPATETSAPTFNPRQCLLSGNPRLASLVTEAIGDRWTTNIEDLQQLAPLADNPALQSRWCAVKQANKQILAKILYLSQGIDLNVNSLFDLQLQSVGTHQRQLLNILHIIALFDRIKQDPNCDIVPRTSIFANIDEMDVTEIVADETETNSSPDRDLAILELIQSLAKIVAADPDVNQKLQIVYIPESATIVNQLYAAADVTEQIAIAEIEDVDLSQLQATVNGVLEIGSFGSTNHWIQQTVGEENYFGFGLAIPELALFKEYGYDPYNYYKYYPQIRQAIDLLSTGYFTPNDPTSCQSLVNELLGTDAQMVLAEYVFYEACQSRIEATYCQPSMWTSMSIANVAGIG